MILSIKAVRDLMESCMTTVGHTDEEAAIIADHLVDCELRGLSFGGCSRALSIMERMRCTAATKRRAISVLRETSVSAALDGGDQVGYLVARKATEVAIEKAKSAGIAVVGASNTWYTGMFSYYLELVTKVGFAGMVAGSAWPQVAPHGGNERRFGTNPIAFGIPSATSPVILDIGTSDLMVGEAVLKMRLGGHLEKGLAYDKDGLPTQDPALALEGAFAVWGGHKGSGLALVMQLLGMICGGAAAPDGIRDCGFFMLVIDPGLLTPAEDYLQSVSDYAARLRETRAVDPDSPVRVPFDRSIAERLRRQSEDAIDVPDYVFEALRRASDASRLSQSQLGRQE